MNETIYVILKVLFEFASEMWLSILWYYQIRPKVVSKMHGAWMDTISRTKTKTLPLRKLRVCFFHAVYYRKKHVIPHPVIAAILNVILNILQR